MREEAKETVFDRDRSPIEREPELSARRRGCFTATVIDGECGSRTRTFAERGRAERWIAETAEGLDADGRGSAAALLSPPKGPPLAMISGNGEGVHAAVDFDSARAIRWIDGRRPRRAVVCHSDGRVETYTTEPAATLETDEAGGSLMIAGIIAPDNPQVLMIDADDRRGLIKVLGPGSVDVMNMEDWRDWQARDCGPAFES